MKLQKATLDHLNMLVPLFDGYRVFYKQTSNVEKAREFLAERLHNEDSILFIALKEGKALGFTQLFPTFSSVTMERFYILNDLFVVPEARGLGIGEKLLRKAQEFVKTHGYKGLALETAVDNPAQRLYERLGWKKSEDFLHYFWEHEGRRGNR